MFKPLPSSPSYGLILSRGLGYTLVNGPAVSISLDNEAQIIEFLSSTVAVQDALLLSPCPMTPNKIEPHSSFLSLTPSRHQSISVAYSDRPARQGHRYLCRPATQPTPGD